ncbi:MAG TPA: serine/threonine-protein kinase, partial [Myxococcota bacterium]|nr:serine/threonine-protein kinase [Myxococcota bacterium]
MGRSDARSLLGRQLGSFKLLGLLGEGGMGTVYRAQHTQIGKRVAIKVLASDKSRNQEMVKRFFNEAAAVNRIGHENIVDISDFGRTPDGFVYFVMELLEGEELSRAMSRYGPLPLPRVGSILLQACSALHAAHAAGIVHRDLKPDNIFLTHHAGRDDYVKILDFGIAKLGEDASDVRTRTGVMIGTPRYMSPEQTEGVVVDHRTDVYSLGVIAYQMVAGQVPFDGPSVPAIIKRICFTEPTPLRALRPDVPEAVERVVHQALQKRPEDRYPSMEALAAAVGAALGLPVLEAPTRVTLAPLPPPGSARGQASAPAHEGARNPTTLRSGVGEVSEGRGAAAAAARRRLAIAGVAALGLV